MKHTHGGDRESVGERWVGVSNVGGPTEIRLEFSLRFRGRGGFVVGEVQGRSEGL